MVRGVVSPFHGGFTENAVEGIEKSRTDPAADGDGGKIRPGAAFQHSAYQHAAQESHRHADAFLERHLFMEEKDGKSNDKKGRHAKKHGGKRQRSVLNGFIISQVDPEHAKDPAA